MQMKMTLSASVVLYRTITKILFTKDHEERKLPFNIRYKLQRCMNMLEKDALYYEQHRVELVKTYGETLEDGSVRVKEDLSEKFNEEAQALLSTEVNHEFMKLTPEEVLKIDVEDVNHDEMDLIIAALINDPEFEADIKTPINNKDGDTDKEVTTPVED